MSRIDGRRFGRDLWPVVREVGEHVELLAPEPGLFREGPPLGLRLVAGARLGELEVLDRLSRLIVPDEIEGVVIATASGPARARRPLSYGERIVLIDPNAGASPAARASRGTNAGKASSGLAFKTPLGGRYYARPAPNADAFVKAGDEIGPGTTVAIVEVMKTFNRVQYGGPGLPARAKVTRVVRKDGEDVASGDALLEIEAIA
jgi:acetyl-CoA carboxylase biotin carboxyl carrier protein